MSDGIELVKQYKENEAKITEIQTERDNFTKARDQEIYELKYKIYWDKIRALEEERDSEIEKVQKVKEEHEATADGQIDELRKVITKVKRLIYFLKLHPSKEWKEEKISAYRDRHLERLGLLYQDEFLDIRLLAAENDRPKNKYTLVAIGRCAFGSQSGWEDSSILELPRAYGSPLNDWDAGTNVECVFAPLPTIDDVKQYYAKHRGELMRSFLNEYQKVKQEYLEVIRTYKLEEFEGIALFG